MTLNPRTYLQFVDAAKAVEARARVPARKGQANRQVRTGTDGRIWDAEIGAEQQENKGNPRQGAIRLGDQLGAAGSRDEDAATWRFCGGTA